LNTVNSFTNIKILSFGRNLTPQEHRKKGHVEATFIYTNDTHGSIANMDKLITGIKQKQKELKPKAPLTISAGDDLLYYNTLNKKLEQDRRLLLVKALNQIKPDFIALGDHEVDNGLDQLAELLRKANFKVVLTNGDLEDTPLKKFKKKIAKSFIVENPQNGAKFGLLGLTPEDETYYELGKFVAGVKREESESTESLVKRRLEATINAIQEEIKILESKGINKIVLASHLGYEKDTQLVKDPRTDGIDIIIEGHSHDSFEGFTYEKNKEGKKPNVLYSPSGKPIIIVQAGCNAEKFGLLNLWFDKNGIIVTNKNGKIDGKNEHFLTKKIEPDTKIKKNLDKTIQKIFKDYPRIGIVKEPINPIISRDKENTLLTATLDGFLELAKKKGTDDIKDLDLAMINSSTVRAGINKGELNEGTLSLSFVFEVPMVKTKASEKQIVDTLKFALDKGNKRGAYDIPQFSSAVEYQITEELEDGKKKLSLSGLTIKGKKINIDNPDTDKKYKIAVRQIYSDTDYWGTAFYNDGKIGERCTDTNGKPLNYVEGLANYLKKHCKDPKTGEINLDTNPKIIKINKTTTPTFSGKKLVLQA